MQLSLKPGVSFCMPGERTVFLDLGGDQYLCLERAAEQSFRRLLVREELDENDVLKLDELVTAGLLSRLPEGPAVRPARSCPVERTLLEEQHRSDGKDIASALWWLCRAQAALRLRSLRSIVATLRERKLVAEFQEPPGYVELARVAAAFSGCSLWASPFDQCLARSIAAAGMMTSRGLRAELVVAVRLQPFSAHCWVQHGALLVNETVERVRNYTPILVV